MERALIKALIKSNEFPIAPALVERYAQVIVNRAKSQLMMMGVDVESVDDGKMRGEVRVEAEEEARGAILLQAIGEREGITASDADVQKRIAELAQGRNESPKQLRAELEKDHRIHQIEQQIREQKTLDLLISQAKITDGEPASSLIVTPDEARKEEARKEEAAKAKAKKKPQP
jgi:trigger factor